MVDKDKVEEAVEKAKEVTSTTDTALSDEELDSAAGGRIVEE